MITAATADGQPMIQPDSRQIYVSKSRGSDSNDGLTAATPKATLAAAAAMMRDGYPDWMLLRRGDEWNEGLAGFAFDGRSADEPAAIVAYGPGSSLPRINPSDPSAAWPSGNHVIPFNIDLPELPTGGDAPTLIPGDGWDGPTPEPAPVGNPGDRGYDAKAIARWDVVPYQTFDGIFEVGVVAFHMNGIDRVDFSVDGGPWESVYEMTLNPRTGVWEYWAQLDASSFGKDGPIEVRAIAWPTLGEPRVLNALALNTNAGGTFGAGEVYVSASRGDDAAGDGSLDRPFKTIYRGMQVNGGVNIDGLAVLLEPGRYAFDGSNHPGPVTEHGWVTIKPAPGVGQDQVQLTPGRVKVKHVAVEGVTLDFTLGGEIGRYDALGPYLWLNNVRAYGPGGPTNDKVVPSGAQFDGLFFTDVHIQDFRSAAEATTISRNVHIRDIGSDAFGDSRLVVNCSVHGIHKPAGTAYHPDLFQFSGRGEIRDNTIVYGLMATDIAAQGLFADDLARVDNSAFVNVHMEIVSSHKSQWKDVHTNHLLLWHVGLHGQPFTWRQGSMKNLSVVGGVWEKVEGNITADMASGFNQNHVIDIASWGANAPGTNVSTGPIGTGIMLGRVDPAPVPVDIESRQRGDVASIGPFEGGTPR